MYYYVRIYYFFFFKQKTAYCMRISDWSSDVCSSDLLQAANVIKAIRASKYKVDGRILPVANADIPATIFCVADLTPRLRQILIDFDANVTPDNQIGRASCRERVCQYV